MRLLWSSLCSTVFLASCSDLSAVTKFAQTAPDVSKLDTLTEVYVSDPQTQIDWTSVWNTPDPSLTKLVTTRQKEKVAIDSLHALIVNYMKSLGGLAGSSVTDVATQAQAVSTNLAALQQINRTNLDAAQATAIGDLVSFSSQNLLNAWRGHEIGNIIKQNQNAFHSAISTEITIVRDAFLLDFTDTCKVVLGARDHTKAVLAPGVAELVTCGAIAPAAEGAMAHPLSAVANPVARAAYFTFRQTANAEIATLNAATLAAQQYVAALQKLGTAYDDLVDQNGHYTAATLETILPLLIDAEKAYVDIDSL